MRQLLAPLLLLCATGASFDAMAQLHKCVDEAGKVSYSDKACVPPPSRVQASPTPAPTKLKDGKLSEEAVIAAVQLGMRLGNQLDYRAQCALGAKDLSFKITDHTQKPPLVISGGRAVMCGLQEESAAEMMAAGITPIFTASNITVDIDASGMKAVAKYDTLVRLSIKGKTMASQRCNREDQLGLYAGQVLFSRAVAVCQPLQ